MMVNAVVALLAALPLAAAQMDPNLWKWCTAAPQSAWTICDPTAPLDARADGDDLTRGLMSHDKRRAAASGGTIPAVDIAAADAASVDAEEDLVVGGVWRREVGVFEVGRGGKEEGFHDKTGETRE